MLRTVLKVCVDELVSENSPSDYGVSVDKPVDSRTNDTYTVCGTPSFIAYENE